jgi:RNA polymerase sigma factor (sigma-70 family)
MSMQTAIRRRPKLTDEQRGLVLLALPVARAIARRFANMYRSLDAEADFLGEASVALCCAAQDYRDGSRATFRTYAGRRVQGACKDVLRSVGLMGYRRDKRRRGVDGSARPDVFPIDAVPFDQCPSRGPEHDPDAVGWEAEADDLPVGWEAESEDEVARLCGMLPAAYGEVVRSLYMDAATPTDAAVARRLGLSPSRVSQIHVAGRERLRKIAL